MRPAACAWMMAACLLLAACQSMGGAGRAEPEAQLLALHEEVMQAHRESNVDLLMRAEAPDYQSASRGQVSQPTLQARRARFEQYFGTTRFDEYVDVVPPVARVSADGSLGWVMVQVRARGEQRGSDGASQPIAFESAWVELYERRGGTWYRIGNVSNFKP